MLKQILLLLTTALRGISAHMSFYFDGPFLIDPTAKQTTHLLPEVACECLTTEVIYTCEGCSEDTVNFESTTRTFTVGKALVVPHRGYIFASYKDQRASLEFIVVDYTKERNLQGCDASCIYMSAPDSNSPYILTQNTGIHTISIKQPSNPACWKYDPDFTSVRGSNSNYDAGVWNAVSSVWVPGACGGKWCINTIGLDWVWTDGLSIYIDTDKSDILTNAWFQWDNWWVPKSGGFYCLSSSKAQVKQCIPTSYTTDMAVTGKTIYYARGSGTQQHTLDLVTANDLSCNILSYLYYLETVASVFTFSQLDISVSSESPAIMTINSYGSVVGPATTTIAMKVGIKAYNNLPSDSSQNTVWSSFTYVVYTPLTNVVGTAYNSLYRSMLTATTTINYPPTWTTTPADLITIISPTNFCLTVDGTLYVSNGVTVGTTAWFRVTGSQIVISTQATDLAFVGTYAFVLSWNWADSFAYNQVKSFSFNVEIYCQVLTVTNLATLPTTLTITIFAPESLFTLGTFAQSPVCGPTPSNTFWQDAMSTGSFTTSASLLTITGTSGSISTIDHTLGGQTVYIKQVADFSGIIASQTMTVLFVDPCATTTLISQTYSEMFQFISALTAISVDISLDDSANQAYGTADDSICYTQTYTVTENSATTTYLSLSGSIVSIQTIDSSLAGQHIVDIVTTLTRYPAVTNTAQMTVTLFLLQNTQAHIDPQSYEVGQPAVIILHDLFQVTPVSSDVAISYTVSGLPAFMTFVVSSSGLVFNLQSQDASAVGSYSFVITAKAAHLNGQQTTLESQTIAVTVNAQTNVTVNATTNVIENFTTSLVDTFNQNQKPKWDSAIDKNQTQYVNDTWSYTLPSASDPQNLAISITVDLGLATIFVSYKNGIFTSQRLTETNVGEYKIRVTLKNEIGLKLVTFITFIVSPLADQRQTEKLIDQNITNVTMQSNKTGEEAPYFTKMTVDNRGLATIQFSKMMIIPSNFTQFNSSMLTITIIPGANSDSKYLNFTWNLTNFQAQKMFIQLQFAHPVYISAYGRSHLDKLSVEVLGPYFLQTVTFIPIPTNTTITGDLPPQFSNDQKATQTINSVTTLVSAMTKGFFLLTFIINVFLEASLSLLWGMVNAFQIIGNLPQFSIYMPANAEAFFSSTVNLQDFSFIPTSSITNFLFSLNNSSFAFFINMGTLFIILLLYLTLSLVLLLLYPCKNYRLFGRLYLILKKHLFWNGTWRYLLQSYFQLSLSSLSSIENGLQWTSNANNAANVFVCLTVSVCAAAPILMTIYLRRHFLEFSIYKFRQKFRSIISRFNFRSIESANFISIFCYRRLVQVCLIVFSSNQVWLQVQMQTFTGVLVMILLGHSNSFWLPSDRRLEFFNEATIMLCVYHCFLLTDFVDDPETRYQIGFSFIAFVCFNLAVNLLWLAYNTLTVMITTYKKLRQKFRFLRYRIKKRLEQQRKKRKRHQITFEKSIVELEQPNLSDISEDFKSPKIHPNLSDISDLESSQVQNPHSNTIFIIDEAPSDQESDQVVQRNPPELHSRQTLQQSFIPKLELLPNPVQEQPQQTMQFHFEHQLQRSPALQQVTQFWLFNDRSALTQIEQTSDTSQIVQLTQEDIAFNERREALKGRVLQMQQEWNDIAAMRSSLK